jgi:hypothetical protein
LGGGDGVFDGVVVGDAAAVFPVHGVCAVIWEGAAVAGKRGGVSFLGLGGMDGNPYLEDCC